jgi:O-antigen ligase
VRFEYWKAGLQILQEHPLLGIGVGNAKEVPAHINELAPGQTTVHNIFLQVALETGTIGWLLFFSFVGLAFWTVRRAAKRLRDLPGWQDEWQMLIAIQVAMISVLIFGLQVDVFDFPLKGWWLLTTIGFVLNHWAKRAHSDETPPATLSICPA